MSEQQPLPAPLKQQMYQGLASLAVELGSPLMLSSNETCVELLLPISYMPEATADRFPPGLVDVTPIFGLRVIEFNQTIRPSMLCIAGFKRFTTPDREAPPNKPPYTHISWTTSYEFADKDSGLEVTPKLHGTRLHRAAPGTPDHNASDQMSPGQLADLRQDKRRTAVRLPKNQPGSKHTSMPPVSVPEARKIIALAGALLEYGRLQQH